MKQGMRQRYEAIGNDRYMWKIYWYYINRFGTRNPPLLIEHRDLFRKADKMMINDLYISNK